MLELILSEQCKVSLNIEQAKQLVNWVIKKYITMDPYVGPPIVMKIITKDGISDVSNSEIIALNDVYEFNSSLYNRLFQQLGNIPEMIKILSSPEKKEENTL